MDYTITEGRIDYKVTSKPLHYTIEEEIGYTIESKRLHYIAEDN